MAPFMYPLLIGYPPLSPWRPREQGVQKSLPEIPHHRPRGGHDPLCLRGNVVSERRIAVSGPHPACRHVNCHESKLVEAREVPHTAIMAFLCPLNHGDHVLVA